MQNLKDPLIFVVEDNKVYNRLIVSYLHSKKFNRIQSFFSGEECLENMDKKPDIIIQDYLLGGVNGIEVLKTVKKEHSKVEFIFLSGHDSIDVALNTIKYGAYDYIIKDQMALKKMVNKINRIISRQQLVKNNKLYKLGALLFFIALVIISLVIMLLAPSISY